MKSILIIVSVLIFQLNFSYAQLGLYNTRTLFDAFENPSQKAFYADSSKKFAFNFFVPTLTFNGNVSGEAQTSLKKFLYNGDLDASGISLGNGNHNTISLAENSYLFMFKVFKAVRFNQEMGVSWQVRSDSYGKVSNESVAIFDNYKLFDQPSYSNPFNDKAYNLNYHQFSLTYREDYNKRLGLGIKLSYLSGIAHTKVNIDSSFLNVNHAQDTYKLSLHGKYRSTLSWDSVGRSVIYPGFKNPGLALSISANYKFVGGWYILGNLKDLGFIRWNKKDAYTYMFDDDISVSSASHANKDRLSSEIQRLFDNGSTEDPYTTVINGKAEVLISKELGLYQPNVLISKNIFHPGGDIALINRVTHRALNFSFITGYNLNDFFQLGGQFMLKSPNAEFFIGSDQVMKSYYTSKGFLTSNENIGKGNTAASLYFGFAVKFGSPMQRQQNATIIPGIESVVKPGFFNRIFSKKKQN